MPGNRLHAEVNMKIAGFALRKLYAHGFGFTEIFLLCKISVADAQGLAGDS